MQIPPHMQADAALLPPALRAVLAAELAAGNEIADVLHGFPVAPVGVGIRMARPLSVPVPAGTIGLAPCRFPNWDGSSGYSDEPGHSFLLGPPVAPPDPPPMEEVRTTADRPRSPAVATVPDSPLTRFEHSLSLNYEQWHDGIGYDLDAIRDASPEDRAAIEARLLRDGVRDWRDVEALALLDTPAARKALDRVTGSQRHELALAVARYAPHRLTEDALTKILVAALQRAQLYGGLTQALELAETHHPFAVMDALWRGALEREGEAAVHYAALLMFLHGKADTPFDWAQRPFFLTFNTDDRAARERAFQELCRKTGVAADPYLRPPL
ncbi:MAG: hypothetical protein U0412_05840 [Nitrospira sp.]